MKLHLRVDETNERHVHVTLFMDGMHCGRLTLDHDEFDALREILLAGEGPGMLVEVDERDKADA